MRANGFRIAHVKQIARRVIGIVKRPAPIRPAQNNRQILQPLRRLGRGNIQQARRNKATVNHNGAAIFQHKRHQHVVARRIKAIEAGREAFLAGRIPRKLYATASSPLEGVIGSSQV